MSSPRYDWWSYVKGMIRRYPGLVEREKELHSTSLSPVLSGLPKPVNAVSDPTGSAAIRELPEINRKELMAVREAIEEFSETEEGRIALKLVDMVYFKRSHTVLGAGLAIGMAEATAKRWNGTFIRSVARKFGLLK